MIAMAVTTAASRVLMDLSLVGGNRGTIDSYARRLHGASQKTDATHRRPDHGAPTPRVTELALSASCVTHVARAPARRLRPTAPEPPSPPAPSAGPAGRPRGACAGRRTRASPPAR